MSGFQVGSACYPSALEAAQASVSSQVGAVLTVGGVPYTVTAPTVTADSITYALREVGGVGVITSTYAYSAQPCGLPDVFDGVQLGWLVGSVWVAVFALMFLTKALRGETGSDYGNA